MKERKVAVQVRDQREVLQIIHRACDNRNLICGCGETGTGREEMNSCSRCPEDQKQST